MDEMQRRLQEENALLEQKNERLRLELEETERKRQQALVEVSHPFSFNPCWLVGLL